MSRTTGLTYLLLIGSAILICISGYVLLSEAHKLASARNALDATNRELAQKQAQLLVVSDALLANQDQAEMIGTSTRNVATNCAKRELLSPQVQALCDVVQWMSSSTGQFVPAYALVAAQRASAASASDWNNVKSRYAGLEPLLPPGVAGHDQWMARIEEGIAYSDYRLGHLDEAEKRVVGAAKLDDRSAFVSLTRLKVACAKKEPKAAIQLLYSDQRRALEESVNKPVGVMNKRYAKLELGYYDEDGEMKLVCADADLPVGRPAR